RSGSPVMNISLRGARLIRALHLIGPAITNYCRRAPYDLSQFDRGFAAGAMVGLRRSAPIRCMVRPLVGHAEINPPATYRSHASFAVFGGCSCARPGPADLHHRPLAVV